MDTLGDRATGGSVDAAALVLPEHVRLEIAGEGARPPAVEGYEREREWLTWTNPKLEAWAPADDFFGHAARWQGKVNMRPALDRRASTRMLSEFMSLSDAPAKRIERFARDWGVLGICPHGLPSSHRPLKTRYGRHDICRPAGWHQHGGTEPLGAWRFYSRKARAIVAVARNLHDGIAPERVELAAMFDPGPSVTAHGSPRPPTLREAVPALVRVVNEWIIGGDVRPQLQVTLRTLGQARLRLETPWWPGWPSWPLFGAIGIRLALEVVGASSFAICQGCGIAYEPGRAPARGRGHYCDLKACQRLRWAMSKRRTRGAAIVPVPKRGSPTQQKMQPKK